MNKLQTNTESVSTMEPSSSKPRRLGRGLSALLGPPVKIDLQPGPAPATGSSAAHAQGASGAATTTGLSSKVAPAQEPGAGRVEQLGLDQIRPSRFQPRRAFDEAALKELAASIRSAGVVQPIVVRRAVGEGAGGYELIAGERRWRAARLAGLARVPAIITEASDEQAAEWALIENLQRADLRPMERADAVRALVERFGLSHAQAAEKIGVDRSSVTNMVRMTELELPIRELLDAGMLTAGHAKALLSAAPGTARAALAKRAAEQGWSVRRLEQAIGAPGEAGGSSTSGAAPVMAKASERAMARGAAVKDLEKQLGEHLGTSVRIRAAANGKRGSLVIRFYDLDHFDGLMQKLGFMLR